jgi:hypothetical protein
VDDAGRVSWGDDEMNEAMDGVVSEDDGGARTSIIILVQVIRIISEKAVSMILIHRRGVLCRPYTEAFSC